MGRHDRFGVRFHPRRRDDPAQRPALIDERDEIRHAAISSTAVLEWHGRKYVIRLVNISPSGAMVIFPHVPHIGETLTLQLLDRGLISAK